jgi:uncharacterized membrane protein required for colicin V production
MSPLAAITTPDVVALGICGLWAIRGAFKGFAWQLVRLVGLALALVAAGLWHRAFGDWLHRTVSIPAGPSEWAAWFLILAGGLVLATFFAYAAKGAVHRVRLGGLDRLFGFVLGAAFMFLVLTVLFLIWGSVWPSSLKATLEGSLVARAMPGVVEAVAPYVPEDVKRRWAEVLQEVQDKVSPLPGG